MKKQLFFTLAMAFSLPAFAANPLWTYEGAKGPGHWGELSPDYGTCHSGKFQSPIDIRQPVNADLAPLNLHYQNTAETLVNNGHTLQVSVQENEEVELDGQKFTLQQYHFHAPSENLIAGKSFPLEAHFVHSSDNNELLVVAVMFNIGAENPGLAPLLAALPDKIDEVATLNQPMNIRPLFPENLHYYRFSGSLTTPPCTEGLRWIVLKDPVTLSQSQLEKFQHALRHANNRPVQPLNGRLIVE